MTWDLVLSAGIWLSGASGPLAGQVVDAATGRGIYEARVELRRAGVDVLSDSVGAFSFGAREVDVDTLLVTHADYIEARVLLGDLPAEELHLRVALRRRQSEVSDPAASAAIMQRARALAERFEGHVWEREDFLAHAAEVQSPLELLVFSGFVERVTGLRGGWCVELPTAQDCAAVWVDGEPGSLTRLQGTFPAEAGAFVIVPPARAPENGLVVVFLLERDS